VAELSRLFGVSRQTAYVWIRRYQDADHDLRALEDLSRRPHANPRATSLAIEDLIVSARRQYPRWGPLKLRRLLVERFPRQQFPGVTTVATILRRRGMAAPRTRRRRRGGLPVVTAPFATCAAPNEVWCMDFKGPFRTGDGAKCYPFTLLDAFSRMCCAARLCLPRSAKPSRASSIRRSASTAFQNASAPTVDRRSSLRRRRPPSHASASGSSALASHSNAPHRRLPSRMGASNDSTARSSARLNPPPTTSNSNVDSYRGVYNFERPHAALELATPATVYRRSLRRYPRSLLTSGASLHRERADRRGAIAWHRHRVFIGEAFAYEHLDLWPSEGERWEVYFGRISIGFLDAAQPRFVPRRRGKGYELETSLTLQFGDTSGAPECAVHGHP
jgi:hypothetical protein